MKLKVPFLNSETPADVIRKIDAAIKVVDDAAERITALKAENSANQDRIAMLKASRGHAHGRVQFTKERLDSESTRYGAPKALTDALEDAQRDYESCVREHEEAVKQQTGIEDELCELSAIVARKTSPIPVTANDVQAVKAAQNDAEAALAKISASIDQASARLATFRVDDSALIEAHRALEDLLADAVDDASQAAEIDAAHKRLREVEVKVAAERAAVDTASETLRRTLAGLERKRDQLKRERVACIHRTEATRRMFFQTEIAKASDEYAKVSDTALTALKKLAAFTRLTGIQTIGGSHDALILPSLIGSAPRTLGDIEPTVENLRATFNRLGMEV